MGCSICNNGWVIFLYTHSMKRCFFLNVQVHDPDGANCCYCGSTWGSSGSRSFHHPGQPPQVPFLVLESQEFGLLAVSVLSKKTNPVPNNRLSEAPVSWPQGRQVVCPTLPNVHCFAGCCCSMEIRCSLGRSFESFGGCYVCRRSFWTQTGP